jgi:hypothetical protein
MFGTIRRHSTWLWIVIIGLTVISFVYWGANPGGQGGGGRGNFGRINGKPVTEEAIVNAQKLAKLQFFFRYQDWPGPEAQRAGYKILEEGYKLLLLDQNLEQLGIVAGDEAKATVAANILRSIRQQGINSLAEFEQAVLKREGLGLEDLNRFIEHEVAMRQLTMLEGLSGRLATPQMVESLYRRENEELSAQVVFFSASNYLARVAVTPDAVQTFFTNQMALYRIPERVQVKYVTFPVSNYTAQAEERMAAVTNLQDQIDAQYLKRGTNYYSETSSSEEAKAKIREELFQDILQFEARLAAAAFADTLMSADNMKASDLDALATQKGLTVQTTAPFAREEVPDGLAVNSLFAQEAFKLTPEEPFGGPVVGDDSVFIIALDQRIPSENARFEDVKSKVEDRYRLQQATVMAREAGIAFVSQLTNGLAAGKTFAGVCTEVGQTPVLLPPFSQSTRELPEVEAHTALNLFKQVALTTPVGSASGFQYTADGGYVAYVQSRLPVDEARMNQELPQYTQFVRQSLGNEAFGEWFSREAQVGLRETPLNAQAPPELAPSN